MKKLLLTMCIVMLALLVVMPVMAEQESTLQILQQPTDASAAEGEQVRTGLVAQGEGLRYQWYLANVDMNVYGKSALTGSEYYVTMRGHIHNRKIYCVVTDRYGNSVRSDTVTLTMTVENDNFAILTQPYAEPVQAGEQALAVLEAQGEGLRYQWYFSNVDMNVYGKSALTGSEYYVTMRGHIHNRNIYCIVTDRYGRSIKSETTTLTMDVPDAAPLQIWQQPTNVSVQNGQQIRTGLLVQGEGLRYQWYLANTNMTVFGKSILTCPDYYVTMKAHIHNRKIYCMITDAYGRTVRSETVKLTMQAADDPHVHSYAEDTIPATCDLDGFTAYYCECGENFISVNAGTKRSHEFSEYYDNWDATCTQNGTETAWCIHCGKELTREKENSMLEHSFWCYQYNDDATCKADGTETAKCECCDATDTRAAEGTRLPHSFTLYHSDNNATCTQNGTETATCDNCDATDVRTVADSKLPHSFTDYRDDHNATCKADGTETAQCDHCPATDTRAIPGTKLAHVYEAGVCLGCGHKPTGVKITTQPKNTTVVAGLAGSVTVTATGDGLTYEWYYKNVGSDTFQLASATGNKYTITMTNVADGRQVYCIVRDKYGNSVQTNTVTFTKKTTSSGDGATGEDGDIFIPFN